MVFLVALSLALDAFSVSVSVGGSSKYKPITFGLYFGIFQFFMPILGYFGASGFSEYLERYSSYISAIIFFAIGAKMLNDAFKNEENQIDENIEINLPLLALATSIDAFAVGISYSFSGVGILFNAFIIGVVAFALSTVGAKLSSRISFLAGSSEIFGGTMLLLLGILALL